MQVQAGESAAGRVGEWAFMFVAGERLAICVGDSSFLLAPIFLISVLVLGVFACFVHCLVEYIGAI